VATNLTLQSDSYPKAASQSNMQTFLLFFALAELSPATFLIAGAISLGLLAIFLHHKLG